MGSEDYDHIDFLVLAVNLISKVDPGKCQRIREKNVGVRRRRSLSCRSIRLRSVIRARDSVYHG